MKLTIENITSKTDIYRRKSLSIELLSLLTTVCFISFWLIPLSLIFRRIIRGIDTGRTKDLRFGKVFITLIQMALTGLMILIIIQHPVPEHLVVFQVISSIFGLFLIIKIFKPIKLVILECMDDKKREDLFEFRLFKSHKLLSIIMSLFRISNFKNENKLIFVLSFLCCLISRILILLSVFMLLASIFQLLVGISRGFDINKVRYTYTIYPEGEDMVSAMSQLIGMLFILLPFIMASTYLSIFMRFIGDILNRTNIEYYKEIDPRNPIVFLRSFSHKKVKIKKVKVSKFHKYGSNYGFIKNLDSLLEKKFWHLGPVFSFQNQNDFTDSWSGSIKQKYPHNNWFDNVKKILNKSIITVVSIADTPSLKDEVAFILSSENIDKSIFLFHDNIPNKRDIAQKMFPNLDFSSLSDDAIALYKSTHGYILLESETKDMYDYMYAIKKCIRDNNLSS